VIILIKKKKAIAKATLSQWSWKFHLHSNYVW